MMRWSEFVASLPPGHAETLVNDLTIGWGYAQLAALTAQANGDLALVVRYLDLAQHYLVAAGQVLHVAIRAGATPEPELAALLAGRAALDWSAFLATLSTDQAGSVTRALGDVVGHTRRIAETVVEDRGVDGARRRLESALDQLHTVWRAVAAASGC